MDAGTNTEMILDDPFKTLAPRFDLPPRSPEHLRLAEFLIS